MMIDDLCIEEQMILYVLAEQDGAATSRDLKDAVEPLIDSENYSAGLSYRLTKLKEAGLITREKTTVDGIVVNAAALTDKAETLLYEEGGYEVLCERRRELDTSERNDRIGILQADLQQLQHELAAFREAADGEECFAEAVDDAEAIELADRLDRLSGKLGHMERRLSELENPDSDKEVPGYKRLDDRMTEVERTADETKAVVERRLDELTEQWSEALTKVRANVDELAEAMERQVRGEGERYGDIADLWTLAMLNHVMLVQGLDVSPELYDVNGRAYKSASKHVFEQDP